MTNAPIEIPDFAAASRLWEVLDDHAPPDDAPAVAGFRVLAPLGAGGQGTTWLAVRDADGKLVAMKTALFRDSEFPTRHWDEIRVLSDCRVSSIARFEGSGIADGQPWLATEFIDGPSLDAWAAGRPVGERIEMLARVADALAQLHAAGIVHRDVKPANVIIAAGDRPVLIDLGLGAFIDVPLDRTIEGLPAGSPAFMSPEQARGERARIGPATDVWSLGATAFLLLAGEPPHASAGSVAAQVARAGTEAPRRASTIAPSLPRPIAEALDWAVQPRIEDRPADAAAFALALRSAAAGASSVRGGARSRRWIAGGCVLAGAIALWFLRPLAYQPVAELDEPTSSDTIPLTTEHAAMIPGDYPGSGFGSSIAVLDDLDGDGLPELAIGAPMAPGRQPSGTFVELAGELSIVRGAEVLAAKPPGTVRVMTSSHRIAGAAVRGHAGELVCAAGDMDGDGLGEIAILAGGPTRETGSVTILRGSELMRTASMADAVASGHAVRIEGIELGKLPSGMIACDIDGDRFSDLLVGCPGAPGPGGARAGEVCVVRGAKDLFGPGARLAATHRVGAPEGVFGFGTSLAVACGPDGASTTEYVAIGAPLGERSGPGGTGRVVLARADALAAAGQLSAPAAIASRGRPDEWFGIAIAAESTALNGLECRTIHVLAGGSGVANASNDGGFSQVIEFTLGDDGRWRDSSMSPIRRGVEAPLGRGQHLGAAVAMRKHFCCSLPCAIASPRDGTAEVAAGSVLLFDALAPGATTTYRGAKRAFGAGHSIAWWEGGQSLPDRTSRSALLIGAPGEDSPSRNLATGAVWVVWVESP